MFWSWKELPRGIRVCLLAGLLLLAVIIGIGFLANASSASSHSRDITVSETSEANPSERSIPTIVGKTWLLKSLYACPEMDECTTQIGMGPETLYFGRDGMLDTINQRKKTRTTMWYTLNGSVIHLKYEDGHTKDLRIKFLTDNEMILIIPDTSGDDELTYVRKD